MRSWVIGLCLIGVLATGCQSLHKSEWVKANDSAKPVYRDSNLEVWNVGDRCYYFLKSQLKYIYQCGNRNAVQQDRKVPTRFHAASADPL